MQAEFEVIHSTPEAMRAAAVELYEQAFGPKLAVAIPDRGRRVALLMESLNLASSFAAVADGRLVGLAGYQDASGSLTDGVTFQTLRRVLGLPRAVWAAVVLGLFERSQAPGQLLMDGIVVAADVRGRGIGTRLLDAVAQHAREQGCVSVRLDVIDTNTAARRLYERNGFVATHTESFGYLRWLLGFGASTTLVRSTAA